MFARVKRLFKAVVGAVKAKGPKILASLAPGGEAAYELCAEVAHQLRGVSPEEARGDLEAVLNDAPEAIQQFAEEAVGEADFQLSPAENDDLTTFLKLIPDTARRAMERSDDPTGTTVPLTFSLHSAENVRRIMPDSLPKMKAGGQPTRDGNWVLVRLLGKGGFGEAWLARHRQSERMHKVFKFCTDPAAHALLNLLPTAERIRRFTPRRNSRRAIPRTCATTSIRWE